MKSVLVASLLAAAIGFCAVPGGAIAEPPSTSRPAGSAVAAQAAYSAAVQTGNTFYVSGTTDGTDPDTGKRPVDATRAPRWCSTTSRRRWRRPVTPWTIWCGCRSSPPDLKDYADFNAVYRTYFKGPLPARAFIGAGSLLGNAHFEVMGMAVKHSASK